MKLQSYELTLPEAGATCVFAVPDTNNAYGGTKPCGKPAEVVAKQETHGRAEPNCKFHFGSLLSSGLLRDQILTTLLVAALKSEKAI